jgi:hypothetical protein
LIFRDARVVLPPLRERTAPMPQSTAAAGASRPSRRPWLKWTLLVCANASLGFVAALATQHDRLPDVLAMLSGIATFIAVYAEIDFRATSKGRSELIRSLKTGVIIKMILQVIPAVEVTAGAAASGFVTMIGLDKSIMAERQSFPRSFARTYLETLLVGAILSVMVAAITAILMYVRHLAALRKAQRPEAPAEA